MKNFVQKGDTITLIAPAGGVVSGQAFMVGSIFAVAAYDAAAGDEVEADVVGVFEIGKAAVAVTQGAPLYWDAAAKVLTTVATGNTLVAAATEAAADSAATVHARLNGIFGAASETALTAAIGDLDTRVTALEGA
jgi:predicted RecA/RadA family phage recombinase